VILTRIETDHAGSEPLGPIPIMGIEDAVSNPSCGMVEHCHMPQAANRWA
jgi:hypothetical protein